MLPSTSRPNWRLLVKQAVRDAKIEVIGHEDVKNQSHAETLIAVLKAYGDSRRGFVYVEPTASAVGLPTPFTSPDGGRPLF